MLSRRSFIRRAAVGVAALALPMPREAAPLSVKTKTPLPPAKAQGERLTEWWYEHDTGATKTPIGISLVNDGKVLQKHYIPPGTGVYFQYPPGREPDPIQSVLIEDGGKVLDYFQVPNRLGPLAVRTHEGYFGMVVA